MRIAIDGRALTGRFTGDRTYWRNLLRLLPGADPDNEYLLYSRLPIGPDVLRPWPNMSCRVVPASNDRLWTLFALPKALRQDKADLVHVQYTAPPRQFCPCPMVTTVHDISFRLYPEWFPARHRLLLNWSVPPSMRQAARVITDSECSHRDILRIYKLPPQKVVTIPLGLPEGFASSHGQAADEAEREMARGTIRTQGKVTAPFVLAVGVLQPRKNLLLLAEAFGRAKRDFCLPHQLVLVGKAGWGTEQEALREAARHGGGPEAAAALVFPGYVEDADLPLYYRACDLFAYPSLYEGFGLPPLEAMACGAPVLTSDAPAMPEVVGDAALILPAIDASAWAQGLGKTLTDGAARRRLAALGPAHAARFTWEVTAQRTRAVYQEAVVGREPLSQG